MNHRERADLDRHITGNWGEDSVDTANRSNTGLGDSVGSVIGRSMKQTDDALEIAAKLTKTANAAIAQRDAAYDLLREIASDDPESRAAQMAYTFLVTKGAA